MLFIFLGVLWGMPYLLIRIAVGTIDPLVVAGSRTLIGALLLLPVALHRNALASAFRHCTRLPSQRSGRAIRWRRSAPPLARTTGASS